MSDEFEGDAVPAEHAAPVDLTALLAEAEARYEKMSANPDHRGDVNETYSAFVIGLVDGVEQALFDALTSEAEVRKASYEQRGVGKIATRHSLAAQVLAGKFAPAADDEPLPDIPVDPPLDE